MIDAILDRKADPYLLNNDDGRNAIQMAAYHGRGDILASLERRGFDIELEGIDSLVAACARADLETARSIATSHPRLLGSFSPWGERFSRALPAQTTTQVSAACSPSEFLLRRSGVKAIPTGNYPRTRPHSMLRPGVLITTSSRTLIAAGSPVNALDAATARRFSSRYEPALARIGSTAASPTRLQHCSPRELPPSASIFPQAMTPSMIYCVFKRGPSGGSIVGAPFLKC